MTNARKARESARENLERVRAAQAAAARRRTVMIGAAVVAAVLVVGSGITAAVLHGRGSTVSLSAVQSFSGLTRNHVTGTVNYPQTPPVGGDHDPTWLNCGIYTAPVRNENAVHDLEHGAVWITYQPDLDQADVAKLTKFATGQTYLDLSPYPGLPTPVVASAWGKQLKLTSAGDPRLAAFVKKYKQGSQTPELGAPCTGGTGTPNG
jgi:Protein of unknown function (DUF3105)